MGYWSLPCKHSLHGKPGYLVGVLVAVIIASYWLCLFIHRFASCSYSSVRYLLQSWGEHENSQPHPWNPCLTGLAIIRCLWAMRIGRKSTLFLLCSRSDGEGRSPLGVPYLPAVVLRAFRPFSGLFRTALWSECDIKVSLRCKSLSKGLDYCYQTVCFFYGGYVRPIFIMLRGAVAHRNTELLD